MNDDVAAFASGFALSAALIVAIGAQNLFVLRQGLARAHVGWIVLLCGAADAVLIVAGVSGVGAVLGALPEVTTGLTLGGAAFLAWYGVAALRRSANAASLSLAGVDQPTSLPRALATTAAFTFLNPHVYIDTVLLMGTAGSTQPASVRPLFAVGAVLASFSWFAALGYGARVLRPLFTRPGAWRLLDLAVGTTMLLLAASLLAAAALP